MGTFFDIPSGLLFVLSLVTTNPNDLATAATGLAAPKSATSIELKDAPCRHSEQAWYAALNNGAGGVAYSGLAVRIFKTSGGRFYVPVAQDREHILKLQYDNAISCFIALSSAAKNVLRLKRDLGREATLSDLYIAHVFGSDQATRILKAVATTPKKRMATLFPTLDAIEPGLYAGRNKGMSVARFVKRVRTAVRRQVYRASSKALRRATKQNRRPRRSKPTSLPFNGLVKKANISARDLLQRGTELSEMAMTSKRLPQINHRFDFGAGLAKTLLVTKRIPAHKSVAF